MTGTFPITPPPELVQQWEEQFLKRPTINGCFIQSYIASRAAQWGADMELEACCAYMQHEDFHGFATELRVARRPKPPSLKELALDALQNMDHMNQFPNKYDYNTIRRALETLDD